MDIISLFLRRETHTELLTECMRAVGRVEEEERKELFNLGQK